MPITTIIDGLTTTDAEGTVSTSVVYDITDVTGEELAAFLASAAALLAPSA